MTEEPFYVGIDTPNNLRKALLLSSRDLLGNLKQYESLKNLRIQKLEAVLELRNTMTEIEKLNRKIKSIFPKNTPDITNSAPVQKNKKRSC